MNTKQPIPNSLKFYRKQAGLRQVDVAAKLGFTSYDRISYWEHGTSLAVASLEESGLNYSIPSLYGSFNGVPSETW